VTDSRGTFIFPSLPEATFRRLPAMFADALPDDFGNALIDAWVAKRGTKKSEVTTLDRLAYMGKRGMGAPEFKSALGSHRESGAPLEMKSLVEFQKSLQSDPQYLKAQANLAAAHFDLRRYPEASSAFARAVELSPHDPYLRTNLGLALEKAGKTDQAKKAFAEAQSLREAQRKNPSASAN
jgi:serine/threonine-protein kinase HipA